MSRTVKPPGIQGVCNCVVESGGVTTIVVGGQAGAKPVAVVFGRKPSRLPAVAPGASTTGCTSPPILDALTIPSNGGSAGSGATPIWGSLGPTRSTPG